MHPTAKKFLKPLARAGYSARGVIYLVIGLFAILAAIGSATERDSEGALRTLLRQPFGTAIVYLLVVGLAGYVLWRGVQAILDADGHGNGAKGLTVRAGLLFSAFTYGTLALFALSLTGVLSSEASSGSDEGSSMPPVAGFLAGIVGRDWVALGLAMIFAGVAAAHVWKAWDEKYDRYINAPPARMPLVHFVAKTGLVARGTIFLVIAVLLFYRFTAARSSSTETDPPNLDAALQFIQDLPYGSVLLGLTGLGLLAFSAYSFVEARWRRVSFPAA